MSDTEIKINNINLRRKSKKNKSQKLDNTILNLKWINKLKNVKNIEQENSLNIKKELEAEEMIENAKIHRQANRPLKKIKEFDDSTKFCQCCYNPMKDDINITNFNYCDSTDEFAAFGTGISFYFFYLKYSIIILLSFFFIIIYPILLVSKKYSEEIINICEKIYNKEGKDINMTFPYCNGFVNIGDDSYKKNNLKMVLFKFNSMNLKQYRDIFLNITNNNENINKVVLNFHFMFFIGLLTLFISHSLYTLLLFNIRKDYDMSVTSPSDYTVIVTNLKTAFDIIFFEEINKKNKMLRNNNYEREKEHDSSRNPFKGFQEIELQKIEKENEINVSNAFKEFLNNIVCGNDNGKPFNIYLINICYKINEFVKIKEKIKEKNSQIYIAKNDPEQLKKNIELKLSEKEYNYFYHPLDIFGLYICPFTLYEKSLKLSEIEKEKQKLEDELNNILNKTKNITKENFSGVVFIIFNTMKQKDKFIESKKEKYLLIKLIKSLLNLKYYLCYYCISKEKRKEYFLKHYLSIEDAPEPEDIIFENLEFSWLQRLLRIFFAYIISFILIAICFFFILYINRFQIKESKENNDLYRYGLSVSVSLVIVIINLIFQKILVYLTEIEKQICMTNFFLSYSIKLTFLTFLTSVIIPFLSSNYYMKQLNHDILIINCFTMFLSNSFLIPISWTFNFDYFLKKLRIYIINKKKKHLPQDELNNLYELLDMDIASKYSYITRTLLMTFFYIPIFPLGLLITFLGFIFSFFLEKYNFMKKYKKPIMLNSRIYEVYSNYFVINLFVISLSDYLFLKNVLSSNTWLYINIFLFSALVIFPYNNILSIDLIGINESDIKEGELYEDYFYNFFNDYERNNPITRKEGIKHFLFKLIEKVLITKNDYDTILQNYEHMNLLEIYYKSKLNLGTNLLKRALNHKNSINKAQKMKKIKTIALSRIKHENLINNIYKLNKLYDKKESEDTKEEKNNINNDVNIYNKNENESGVSPSNKGILLNLNKENKIKKKIKIKIKKKKKIFKKKDNKKIQFGKDIIIPDNNSKINFFFSKKNTIEDDDNNNNNDSNNILNINKSRNKKK